MPGERNTKLGLDAVIEKTGSRAFKSPRTTREAILRERRQAKELWFEAEGPDGVFAIFEEEESAGYFCAYKPQSENTSGTVLAQVRVYLRSDEVRIAAHDIIVMCQPIKLNVA